MVPVARLCPTRRVGQQRSITLEQRPELVLPVVPFHGEPKAVRPHRHSGLRIGRDDFYDLLSDNMEITASIFTNLVKRFRKLVEQ